MDEWYTAPRYIELAREVLGHIDLDPASSPIANRVVQADKFYTIDDNGLELPWYGKVWLNPPYGRSNNVSILRIFIEKLVTRYEAGDIEEAIVCTTADIDELWWRLLVPYLVCFPDHHVYYNRLGGTRDKHMLGTAFTYLGKNEQRFIDVFGEIGPVYKVVSRVKTYINRQGLWQEGV